MNIIVNMLNIINVENIDNNKIINGTILHPYKINSDESGILVETLRTDWEDVINENMPFAMQYYSITQPGVARDENLWHYHPGGQQDRFLVVSGSIVVAVADNEKDSLTYGVLNLFHLDCKKDPYLLVVPKRTLHTFLVSSKEPAILLNFPTKLYDPKEEWRIPFDEAKVVIEDKKLFNWNMVREHFNIPLHKN